VEKNEVPKGSKTISMGNFIMMIEIADGKFWGDGEKPCPISDFCMERSGVMVRNHVQEMEFGSRNDFPDSFPRVNRISLFVVRGSRCLGKARIFSEIFTIQRTIYIQVKPLLSFREILSSQRY
jgi:hypothetical protein